MNRKVFHIILSLLLFSLAAFSQSEKKTAELKNLEASVTAAKARVKINERKVTIADSLITSGKKLFDESKTDLKSVDSDSRKLEKDYETRRKSLQKLMKSDDKAEASRAKTEMKALETEYKSGNRALELRLKDAQKKQTAGANNIIKGKTAHKNAKDLLKSSLDVLRSAEMKYNAASAPEEKSTENKKSRK